MIVRLAHFFFENLFRNNFKILDKEDPIYFFKAIKNKSEIKHMINAHTLDGVALTRFLYWIKKSNKKKLLNLMLKIN